MSVLKPYGKLIASDANSDDYAWTETFLKRALHRHSPNTATELAYISKQRQIDMISVHFYTFSGNDWGKKSPADGFMRGLGALDGAHLEDGRDARASFADSRPPRSQG